MRGERERYDGAMTRLYASLGLGRPAATAAARKAAVARLAGAAAASPRGLRPDQAGFLEALARHAADPLAAPVASTVQPGGSGKTTVVVDLLRRIMADAAPPRTILLEPTRVILRQVRDRLADGAPPGRAAVMADGARVPGVVTAMTHARFAALARDGRIGPDDVDLLILDEAHRMLSDVRAEVLDRFLGRTFVMAATASPAFDEGKAVDRLLGTRNRVWTMGAQALRDAGVLAEVTNVVIGVRIEGPMPGSRLDRALVRRQAIAEAAVAALTRRWPLGGRSVLGRTFLFYGQDVAHAEMLRDLYDAEADKPARLSCATVSGRDTREHVESTLDDLASGRVTGVSNARLLGEGYDLPRIRVVANSPTRSLVRQIQQSARAHRVDGSDPEHGRHSFVLDFYVEENGVVAGPPRWYHEAMDEAERAERPLLFTYDTTAPHPSVEPYRAFEVAFDAAVDGPADATGDGPAPVAARAAGAGAVARGAPPTVNADAVGRLEVDWRVEDVVALRAACSRKVAKADDDCDVREVEAMAASFGVSGPSLRTATKAIRRAVTLGAASIAVEGVTLHPVRRHGVGRQGAACVDVAEAAELVAALARREAARHVENWRVAARDSLKEVRDEMAEALAMGAPPAPAGAADGWRPVEVDGVRMRVTHTRPDGGALGRLLAAARVSAGLGRPLELRDGSLLTCALGARGGRDAPTVHVDARDVDRVAAELDLAPAPRLAPVLTASDATAERFMDLHGRRRDRDPATSAAWAEFARSIRLGEGEAVVAGRTFHPFVAKGGHGSSIAISAHEAVGLAHALWGAPGEGWDAAGLRDDEVAVAAVPATWPDDARSRATWSRTLDLLPAADRKRALAGQVVVVLGSAILTRRFPDPTDPGTHVVAMTRDQAGIVAEAAGEASDGRTYLARTRVEDEQGVCLSPTAWAALTLQWGGGERAVVEGGSLRGETIGWGQREYGRIHPDDVPTLLRGIAWRPTSRRGVTDGREGSTGTSD